MRMLGFYGLRVSGLRAVVLGRSNIVGKPMASLLLKDDATVTLAHSHTPDLPGLCRQADVLVTATGIPGMVGSSFVKPGAIVIDVGITRTPAGLKGDVLFEEVEQACGWITPVPGGVGLLTIAMLLSNTLDCRLALQGVAGATS
jgi:methylenetetrahydrofolate dehydrogenase (NADP+)/methenyltetrahydrofolate cyclohydrolase